MCQAVISLSIHYLESTSEINHYFYYLAMFSGLRGGAGADPSWHKSGRGLNKLNSIHDFVACGEYLVSEGFIHRNQLAALGVSAGCLLVGAAVNMYPELFRAAILKVSKSVNAFSVFTIYLYLVVSVVYVIILISLRTKYPKFQYFFFILMENSYCRFTMSMCMGMLLFFLP